MVDSINNAIMNNEKKLTLNLNSKNKIKHKKN